MMLGMTGPPSAEHFDRWYADMSLSSAHEAVVMRTLGLPPALESTSLLPWQGISDVAAALNVGADEVLIDLACGRGGYGLEIARRTGARLIGVDFSQVAVNRAREKASRDAEFRLGELTATGLPDGTAAAVMCIDAMQFAEPLSAGVTEAYRVLQPGGRLVLTGWQALDPDDEVVSARLRHDIGAAMAQAGFVDVAVTDMPDWKAAERALWEAAVALDPAGDPALESLHDEGERVLPQMDHVRRVLAVGRIPDAAVG
jgi:SAM-dependent methyltransferase